MKYLSLMFVVIFCCGFIDSIHIESRYCEDPEDIDFSIVQFKDTTSSNKLYSTLSKINVTRPSYYKFDAREYNDTIWWSIIEFDLVRAQFIYSPHILMMTDKKFLINSAAFSTCDSMLKLTADTIRYIFTPTSDPDKSPRYEKIMFGYLVNGEVNTVFDFTSDKINPTIIFNYDRPKFYYYINVADERALISGYDLDIIKTYFTRVHKNNNYETGKIHNLTPEEYFIWLAVD